MAVYLMLYNLHISNQETKYTNSAVETLRGISLVKKEIPGCFTTLGLSNISFGLPSNARKIINSVFASCTKSRTGYCYH